MHRIPGHENKCRAFHGHRYVAELTCAAPHLDEIGRVVDFGVMKDIVGRWIDDHWDHTALLMRNDPDPTVKAIVESNERYGQPVYLMEQPPTAENLAAELAKVSNRLLEATPVCVTRVTVWETPNCFATWSES
jgi:6-pyruvoyltetrahydropterin/6-carboxytetrahydropterin synthase